MHCSSCGQWVSAPDVPNHHCPERERSIEPLTGPFGRYAFDVIRDRNDPRRCGSTFMNTRCTRDAGHEGNHEGEVRPHFGHVEVVDAGRPEDDEAPACPAERAGWENEQRRHRDDRAAYAALSERPMVGSDVFRGWPGDWRGESPPPDQALVDLGTYGTGAWLEKPDGSTRHIPVSELKLAYHEAQPESYGRSPGMATLPAVRAYNEDLSENHPWDNRPGAVNLVSDGVTLEPRFFGKWEEDEHLAVKAKAEAALARADQHLPSDPTERKEAPMARGLIDYFPDALAEVAHTSFVANEQHNPGEPMHWAREKSNDHADCIVRHLADRGTLDSDGLRHSAKIAWRALALLQLEIEAARALGSGAS